VASRQSLRALDALNFFLADVRGPSHGWDEATVGSVITIAGIVGLIAQAPAGALIDRARNRRAIIVVAAVAVTISSVALPFVDGFALITATQAIAAMATTRAMGRRPVWRRCWPGRWGPWSCSG
jgi:MFS family permease